MASYNGFEESQHTLQSETQNEHMANSVTNHTYKGRVVTTESADGSSVYAINASNHMNIVSQRSATCGIGITTGVTSLCDQLLTIAMDDDSEISNVPESTCYQVGGNGPQHIALDVADIFRPDREGDTLLHSGIILQETSFSIYCINMARCNASLSSKNVQGQTPLHLAVLLNQGDVVRRLIVGGAEITSRDKNGNTPLHIACREGFTHIVESLLEPVRYNETKQNSYEIPYQRVPQNLEITNYDGLNCLHIASSNSHWHIVKSLIEIGADINSREGKTGRTILHKACVNGSLDLVKLLLRYKDCNINALAYNGHTPFDLARDYSRADIMLELAAAGAHLDEEDDDDME